MLSRRVAVLYAPNKSRGHRWSPIPNPPPAGRDRLYGIHSVLNTLRVFALSSVESKETKEGSAHGMETARRIMHSTASSFSHPHRPSLVGLYVRDFSLEKELQSSAIKEVSIQHPKSGAKTVKKMKVIPPQYKSLHQLTGLAKYMGVPIHYVPRKELVELCGERRNQNCVLEVSAFRPRRIDHVMDVDGLLDSVEEGTLQGTPSPPRKYILYLDHIIDPTNVGNLIRTCFFFNISDIILSKDCSACTSVVSRASTGFLEYMNVYQVRHSTIDFIKASREKDTTSRVRFTATTAHSNTSEEAAKGADDDDKEEKEEGVVEVLLLGNEDQGLSANVLQECDYTVHLTSPRQQALEERYRLDREHSSAAEAETAASSPPRSEFERQREYQHKRLCRLKPKEVSLNVNTACAVLLSHLLHNTVHRCPVVKQEQKVQASVEDTEEENRKEDSSKEDVKEG